MKPAHIKHLIESDLEIEAKVVIVANYFGSFCSSNEIIELIENPETNSFVIMEILRLFSQVSFYGSNKNLVNALINVYQNRNRYSNIHVKEVISGMGLQDVTLIYDRLIEDPAKYVTTISDGLYGANVEYLANVIANNQARLMPALKALASTAQASSTEKNVAYCALVDICYAFSKNVTSNLPHDLVKNIATIEANVGANKLGECLREVFTTWRKLKCYYFDYNRNFESIHTRYHARNQFQKESSIAIENVAAIRKAVTLNTPVTSLMLRKSDLANLLTFTGIGSSGFVHIIPCFFFGEPKGLIALESEEDPFVDLPYLLGAVVIGKHAAKIVHESAEKPSAMRYYYDFVKQHEFTVTSLSHEVNFAIGRINDSIKTLRKEKEAKRNQPDVISDIEEARDIIEDSLGNLEAYYNPLVVDKNINEVVENVLRVLKTYLKKEKMDLQFDKDLDNGIIVSGEGINTILTNILRNSVKATQANKGNREIRIAAKSTHGKVLVTITDNGCGIAPDIREKIYDEGVTTWGRGFGLTMVKFLLKEMGGEIEIGNPPKGAEFTISLPRGGRNVEYLDSR